MISVSWYYLHAPPIMVGMAARKPKGATETIGARVKAARERAGMSQEELGRAAVLGAIHISKIERGGIQDPGALTVGRIAQALGVTTDELILGRRRR